MIQSSSPVYHTWLVRLLSCTVKKLSAVTLPTEPPMTMFKARAAWDKKYVRRLREFTTVHMDHTLTSKQEWEDEYGDETHWTM